MIIEGVSYFISIFHSFFLIQTVNIEERQLISKTISVFLIKVAIFFVDFLLVSSIIVLGNWLQANLDNFGVDFRYLAY